MFRDVFTRLTLASIAILSLGVVLPKAVAQTETATITGRVTDPTGAVVPNTVVHLVSLDRGSDTVAKTNSAGIYVLPSVVPGRYRMRAERDGFKVSDLVGLSVNVQDNLEENFRLEIGSLSESVTVNDEGSNINTTDAAVGTVIDRQFVENIPMNGRSFQTLVLLSPGVVTNNPNGSDAGEYSVNGQRTDANGFQVDGASASNAPSYGSTGGSSGMLPSATALGTTQAMLQLDAMEEFRISTSTYSAEFGNHPGAQISFRSRTGTNTWHGTGFDYLRSVSFDSNNWFNTYGTVPIPTPAEHQNDFGGTLGGPLSIPHLYSGRDHLFFFFSFEGLRLNTPSAANIYDSPSNGTYITNNTYYSQPAYAQWANLRKYAPTPQMQQLLNSYPLPNCTTAMDPQCVDYGEGAEPYIASDLTKGVIDTLSARIDYQATPWMRIFARYADSNSGTTIYDTSAGPYTAVLPVRNRTFLLGVDNTIGGGISNELRMQYAPASFLVFDLPYARDGAQPFNLAQAEGAPWLGETVARLYLPNETSEYVTHYGRFSFQPNVTEALTWTHGRHLFKFGGTWMQTTTYFERGNFNRGPFVTYSFTGASQVLSGIPTGEERVYAYTRQDPTFTQWGVYAQDEWRIFPRLTLSLGVRWELAPAPHVSGAQGYTYTGNVNDPSSLALSTLGAPLYATKWTDFAPRFGLAYVAHNEPGHETVIRVGAGMYYDSLSLNGTFGGANILGTRGTYNYSTPFPLQWSQINLPIEAPTKPYAFTTYPANNLVPPYTLQGNAALEQEFGSKQTVTIGYVGSLGRKLNTYKQYSMSSLTNGEFGTMELYSNGPDSSYNALQVKYQRQMARGFQALVSYTWAHAIDWASSDTALFPLERADSDHDVRHVLNAAFVYNLRSSYSNALEKAILAHWTADLWFVARTAFPYQPTGVNITDPDTGDVVFGELNWNGQNPYLYQKGIPGGRQVNPAVFSTTTQALEVGNMPRNMLRSFGEVQANVALERSFQLYERSRLQFRAEAFNLANHPNFGAVSKTCGPTTLGTTCNNPIMGQATSTLNNGLGNLSSQYQQGGPRSLELMLKLQF